MENILGTSNIGGGIKSDLYNTIDYNASIYFMNNVLSDMKHILTSRELNELQTVLQTVIMNYSIALAGELHIDIPVTDFNNNILTKFIEDKKLQGLSERTLTYYQSELNLFFDFCGIRVDSITTENIREYFTYNLEVKHVSPATIDNTRRIFSSFWNYCVANGLLYSNPTKKIDRVKNVKKIKKPFSNNEVIVMREHF